MITSLVVQDAHALAILHGLCFEHAWDAQAFRELLELPSIQGWCVKEREALIAALLVQKNVDFADVITLMTHPDHRNKGLALTLLEGFCVQSDRPCFVEVSQTNLSAISLYHKLGFQQTRVRKNYYRLPADAAHALVMRWDAAQE